MATLSTYNFSLGTDVWLANYSLHPGGNTNNHYGRGVFDEWIAWNRVLSASEVADLYSDQLSGQTNL